MLIDLLPKRKVESSRPAIFWALGRLGARQPVYGPLNTVLPPDAAAAWLKRLIEIDSPDPMAYFAAMQIARRTADRYRDVPEKLPHPRPGLACPARRAGTFCGPGPRGRPTRRRRAGPGLRRGPSQGPADRVTGTANAARLTAPALGRNPAHSIETRESHKAGSGWPAQRSGFGLNRRRPKRRYPTRALLSPGGWRRGSKQSILSRLPPRFATPTATRRQKVRSDEPSTVRPPKHPAQKVAFSGAHLLRCGPVCAPGVGGPSGRFVGRRRASVMCGGQTRFPLRRLGAGGDRKRSECGSPLRGAFADQRLDPHPRSRPGGKARQAG